MKPADSSPHASDAVTNPSSVRPADSSPHASDAVTNPSSVGPADSSPHASDAESSPAIAKLMPVTTRSVRVSAVSNNAFISAASSSNEQVVMDMLLSNNRVNVNMRDKMRRICLHWAGNYGMARLAELLLYRTNTHMDILDDNGDTATILPVKTEHASVAMLML